MMRFHSSSPGGGAGNRSVPQARHICASSVSISSSESRQSGCPAKYSAASPADIQISSISSLHRSPPVDGRGNARAGEGENAARPGKLRRGWAYVNDGWIGDLIGGVALFAALWMGLVIAAVLS